MNTYYTEYTNAVYYQHNQTSPLSSQHVGRMSSTSKDLTIGSNNMNKLFSRDPRALVTPELSPVENNHAQALTTTTTATTTTATATTTLIRQPSSSLTSALSSLTPSPPTRSYFTWLVFLREKWVPFDDVNQFKLEQTLTLGGTFVDITDSHFKKVKRVRVFPKNYYLSYLGVKYRLSRIMQPDAWLDHVNLKREASESSCQQTWARSEDN
ncbi:hypothetical protein BX666DRAFT_1900126 [Dichotomocladium elegans]|nr:hypothetical protein BX666DRAFT_1900126 [Dichotomocladium elegans]